MKVAHGNFSTLYGTFTQNKIKLKLNKGMSIITLLFRPLAFSCC